MRGFVTYENKDYPFYYCDGKLNLFPSEYNHASLIEILSSVNIGEVINNIVIEGTTTDNKAILFEVSEQCEDSNGFLSFNVYSYFCFTAFKYEYYYEKGERKQRRNPHTIRGMKLRGQEIDIFYPPARAFSFDYQKEHRKLNVEVKQIHEIPMGILIWRDVEVAFSLQHRVNQREAPSPILCKSELIVTFNKEVDLGYIKELYSGIYQTLRYIMRRNNISIDDIEIFDFNSDELRYVYGNYYEIHQPVKLESHKRKTERVLPYYLISEHFANLVKLFIEGKIYIDNLPSEIGKSRTYAPDRMLFDFVAFEREYANLYPETETRSEHYLNAKNSALSAIDKLISEKSGKEKKYLSTFRKRIATDENNLSQRMMQVIIDCKEIMQPFFSNMFGKDYSIPDENGDLILEVTTDKLNKLRNDMAHGNLDIKIEKDHVFGFMLIEALLYAMRLKSFGIDKPYIQEGINRIMGFNLYIEHEK